MNTILLANIGNRNMYYRNAKGDYITVMAYIKELDLQQYILLNEQFLTEDYDFKSFTKNLWENLSIGKEDTDNISLRVLSLDDLKEKPYTHLYLFFTDQGMVKQAYQDTLYEAEIMKFLIRRELPDLKVESVHIPGNPTDEQNLYTQYARVARKLIEEHPDAQLIFHDLGGTTQMKNATKVIFEYYLKQHGRRLSVRYKDHWSENSRETDRGLHVRYLLLDVAGEFIAGFKFGAAASVLQRRDDPDLHSLRYHLQLAEDRLQFRFRPAPAEYKRACTNPIPAFESYAKKIVPDSFLRNYPESERATLFEIASICQFYFEREDYTLGVATYYRLCEELCQSYVEHFVPLPLGKDFQRKAFVRQAENTVKTYFAGELRYGLPLLIAYCFEHASRYNDPLRPLFETLIPGCTIINGHDFKGLNQLRNKCWLAHDNKAISRQDIVREVPDFLEGKKLWNRLIRQLGMPGTNVFVELQSVFLHLIRVSP